MERFNHEAPSYTPGTGTKKHWHELGRIGTIWRILGAYRDSLELTGFTSLLKRKCQIRNVSYQVADDFFKEKMLSYVERTWDQWLGNLVPQLPTFETVMSQLRPQIVTMLKGD